MKKDKRIIKDAKVLKSFIGVYCRKKHNTSGGLCSECRSVLEYALKRNRNCPLDPKPKCKDCAVHCYKPDMRAKIKEIMRFSGIYYVKRGRVDWLFHYFF